MKIVVAWFCFLAVTLAGCSEPREELVMPLPDDAPEVVIGGYESVQSPEGGETVTWQIAGSGVGELVLRLLRFEDGAEEIVGEQRFVVSQDAVAGSLTVKSDMESVECNLSLANASPIRGELPATQQRMWSHARGVTFKSLPNNINQAQLWSRLHGDRMKTVASLSPWAAQRAALLKACVDGLVATVVTIEMATEQK